MKHSIKEITVNKNILREARELYQKNEPLLESYLDELLDWNQKINLVSRSVSRETVREHVVHSLIPVVLGLMGDIEEWIDSGTGGGLPGIPLSIVLNEKTFWLNDNVKKKVMAVSGIVDALGLENVKTLPKSISLVGLKTGTGIVTKHAFKIGDLLRLTKKKPWKKIIMWKGIEGAKEEIKRIHSNIECTLYSFNFGEEFYEGKGLVVLEK
ncbi:16S rRNA (guanine(527)-N(7))-methyltransferase RsmG [Rhodohalobacter barkolensis]|uniref:16S rRNA (guanine(527)-N(7))-methyltransferase RsmG n=1 Tax=Rhodohalobacter barkolensis TaxID=2053187 RepID=UPI0013FD524F|nr:RsmG family class I SAM-dependent methyltransferase [Rhodohalobacter barkolensis]